MAHSVFEVLTSAGGLTTAAVLLVAGSVLAWVHRCVNAIVRDERSRRQICEIPDGDIYPRISAAAGLQR